MSKVLFLSMPSHGNVNPTLGLVSELVKQGEDVVYFSSLEFREKVEATDATFKAYAEDLDIFKAKSGEPKKGENKQAFAPLLRLLGDADKIVADILSQVCNIQFDYMVHSAPFPFTTVIAQILKLPTVSSLAVFSGIQAFMAKGDSNNFNAFPGMDEINRIYNNAAQNLTQKYGVQMPDSPMKLLMNVGELNFIYTSEYFIAPEDRAFFDNTFKFVGPPIYRRKENMDFSFELLEGKQVIYISLGTVFGNFNPDVYDIFFKAFADFDGVVVMTAYQVDTSKFDIPANFIVRNYVPQSAILKYASAAVTHAGMNSISDLVDGNIPFVSIPLGADQPLLAKRAEELGATIALNIDTLGAAQLRAAVDKVMADPSYKHSMQKINQSFKEAGGYPKAVEEIFKLKTVKGID